MNSKIFTILIAVLAILVSSEGKSRPNFTATKDDVTKAINELAAQISEIKKNVTNAETEIVNEHTSFMADATKKLDSEKKLINSQIDELSKICQDKECRVCFKQQDEVETYYEDSTAHIQHDSEGAFNSAIEKVHTFNATVGDYEKKVADFRTTLDACKDDDDTCISGVGSDVASYQTDIVNKDDVITKAKGAENTFTIKIQTIDERIVKTYNTVCDDVLDPMRTCVDEKTTTVSETTVTDTPVTDTTVTGKTNTSPTTQKIETTTNNQAKVALNVFIFISMLVVTKIFA